MTDWRMEEHQIKMAIQGLNNGEAGDRVLDAFPIRRLPTRMIKVP